MKLPIFLDTTEKYVMRHQIIGYFVMWASRQSPYLQPENFEQAIKEFDLALKSDKEGFIKTNFNGVKEIVCTAIQNSPHVTAWSIPKSKHESNVYVSRNSSPNPDDDFIDLSALVSNIAQSLWIELSYHEDLDNKKKV